MNLTAAAAHLAEEASPLELVTTATVVNKEVNVSTDNLDEEALYRELEIITVPEEWRRFLREKRLLPPYFMKLSNKDAWDHLICNHPDPEQGDIVTHLLAVPLAEFDPTYPDHLLCFTKDMNVNQLRKICSKFGRKNPRTRDECRGVINQIKKEPSNVEKLKAIDLSVQNTDTLNRTRIVFRLTTHLFGVEAFRDRFSMFNKKLKRPDFEGRFIDTFYSDLREAINNNSSETNDELLPCPEASFQEQYESYLSIQSLGLQHPSYPVIPIDARNNVLIPECISLLLRMRVVMIKNLTKSGTHDTDAFLFTMAAFRGIRKMKFISQHALYYFFMHAKANPGIMEGHSRSLPSGIAGGNFLIEDNSTIKTKKRSQMEDIATSIQKGLEGDTMRREAIANRKMTVWQMELVDRRRNECISELKKSISSLQKQQFKYFNLVEKATNQVIIDQMFGILNTISKKLETDENTLNCLEKERLDFISSLSSQIPRTPFAVLDTTTIGTGGNPTAIVTGTGTNETPGLSINTDPFEMNQYRMLSTVDTPSLNKMDTPNQVQTVPMLPSTLNVSTTASRIGPMFPNTSSFAMTASHVGPMFPNTLSFATTASHVGMSEVPYLSMLSEAAAGTCTETTSSHSDIGNDQGTNKSPTLTMLSEGISGTHSSLNDCRAPLTTNNGHTRKTSGPKRVYSRRSRGRIPLVSNKCDDESDESSVDSALYDPRAYKVARVQAPNEPNYDEDSNPIVFGPQF